MTKYAGLSGPLSDSIAQRMVNEVFHAGASPNTGIGVFRVLDDVLEVIMAEQQR